ncbi:MAG: agmatinase [bacterium]
MKKNAVPLLALLLFLGTVICSFARDFSPSLAPGDKSLTGTHTFCCFPFSRNLDGVDVAVVGIPQYQGMPYRSGTRFGPDSIRAASNIYGVFFEHGKGIYDIELDRYLLGGLKIIDYGDLPALQGLTDKTAAAMTSAIKEIVDQKIFLVAIGGDHSISFPIVRAYENTQLDIIHFDAHLDFFGDVLGVGMKYSPSNPIERIASLPNVGKITQIGIRGLENSIHSLELSKKRGARIITADKIHRIGTKALMDLIPPSKNIYVTIDIDVLDPSVAPGTSKPALGGLSYLQMAAILRALPGKGKIIGFDVVEVNPLYDSGERTSQTAARLILDFLGAIMESRAKK